MGTGPHSYKFFLIAGLIITELMALCDNSGLASEFGGSGSPDSATGVPFWPIWWSQTGLSHARFRNALFCGFVSLASAEFGLHVAAQFETGAISRNAYRVGTAGAGAFLLLGLVNGNSGLTRVLHGAAAACAGAMFVAYLWFITPDPHRRQQFVLFFAMLFLIEASAKRIGGWEAAAAATAPGWAVNLFRLSSLAQWTQLFAFVVLS